MSAEYELQIPHVSYETLNNIVHAYGSFKGKDITPEEVGKVAGIDRTAVSRASKFLTSAGILTTGKRKKLTDSGNDLALAIGVQDANEISADWRRVLFASNTIQRITNNVKINKPSQDKLPGIIQRNFNIVNPGKYEKTGINTIKDLLFKTGILEEENGSLAVLSSEVPKGITKPSSEDEPPPHHHSNGHGAKNGKSTEKPFVNLQNPLTNTTININVQISLPENGNSEIYDSIFASMKKHLISNDD